MPDIGPILPASVRFRSALAFFRARSIWQVGERHARGDPDGPVDRLRDGCQGHGRVRRHRPDLGSDAAHGDGRRRPGPAGAMGLPGPPPGACAAHCARSGAHAELGTPARHHCLRQPATAPAAGPARSGAQTRPIVGAYTRRRRCSIHVNAAAGRAGAVRYCARGDRRQCRHDALAPGRHPRGRAAERASGAPALHRDHHPWQGPRWPDRSNRRICACG